MIDVLIRESPKPLRTTMRLAQDLDDKADYMPSPEEIRSEAAKIRKTWSPRERAKRAG